VNGYGWRRSVIVKRECGDTYAHKECRERESANILQRGRMMMKTVVGLERKNDHVDLWKRREAMMAIAD